MENLKFYKIDFSILNIGRDYPQIQQVSNTARNQLRLIEDNAFSSINGDIIVDYFIIERGVKLTDLISVSSLSPSQGILISKRMKELFQQYNLGVHCFIPVLLKKRGSEQIVETYFLFIIEKKGYQHLDFAKYQFYYSNDKDNKFNIFSYQEYEQALYSKALNVFLNCHNFKNDGFVYVKNTFPKDVGVIYWGDSICWNKIYVSETVKLMIENHKLSGIEFEEEVQIIVSN